MRSGSESLHTGLSPGQEAEPEANIEHDRGWLLRAIERPQARVALWPVAFKVVFILGTLAAVSLWDDFDVRMFRAAYARWPRVGEPVFASHFATWDAAHYLSISERLYHHGSPSCVFYPLWPLLVRWAAPLFGGHLVLTSLIAANLCSLFAWLLFYRLAAKRWGDGAAGWSLCFLIAFPGSLFFQLNYSENLFFPLVLLLWHTLEERRWGQAAIPAFLLPLTRAVGIIAALPVAFYALAPIAGWWQTRRGTQEAGSTRAGGFPLKEVLVRSHVLLWLLAGWLTYLLLMWHWTGHPFEGFSAHHFYNAHSITNIFNLPKFIAGFLNPGHWHEYEGSVLDRALFVLLLWTLPVIWRLDKKMVVWTYMLGILPAMSGTFQAFTRYVSCAFPMFIALGWFFAPPERRWARYGLLLLFGVLQLVLVWRYLNFRWAG